uniref:39S ribosomal protein L4, mitochondrial n=1 Tax=Panagrolaimus sp. JU765 TaxID=591449 RepID=A0AC34QT32_9BILA
MILSLLRQTRGLQIYCRASFSSIRPDVQRDPFVVVPEAFVTTLSDIPTVNVDLIQLNPEIFRCAPRLDLLHRNVIWQTNYRNLQLTKQLTRAEMPGGGRKPWPQKKMGRHHAGSVRAPGFYYGGFAHGVRGPRTWFYMLPDAVRLKGLCTALTIKHAQNDLVIADDFGSLKNDESQFLHNLAEERNWGYSVLFVDSTSEVSSNLVKAVSQIPSFNIIPLYGLNCYSIMKHDTLVISKQALEELEQRLMKQFNRTESLQKKYKYMDYKPLLLGEGEKEEDSVYPPIV